MGRTRREGRTNQTISVHGRTVQTISAPGRADRGERVSGRAVRLSAVAVLAALSVLGLAGCGASGGEGSKYHDASDLKAALEKADFDCKKPKDYEPDEDELDLQFMEDPAEELNCTKDGATFEAAVWEKETDRIAAVAAVTGLACIFGGEDWSYLAEGGWFAAVQKDDETDEDVLKDASKALGVDVTKQDCGDSNAFSSLEEDASSTTTEPKESTGPGSTKDDALEVGDAATVGDYTVRVTTFDTNATDAVLAANEFNEAPENDRYVVATYDATYEGDEEGDPSFDLSVVFSGGDAVQYDSYDCGAVLADSGGGTVEPGGTVTTAVCFDVPDGAVEGAAIFVEDSISWDDADRIYWTAG